VYNTTEFNSEKKGSVSGGQVCYTHNSSIPQSTKIHITCKGYPVGILIRLQLHSKRYQLVLCDFRLYGGEILIILSVFLSFNCYNFVLNVKTVIYVLLETL
jgi:hypothetical protein